MIVTSLRIIHFLYKLYIYIRIRIRVYGLHHHKHDFLKSNFSVKKSSRYTFPPMLCTRYSVQNIQRARV